MPFYGIGMLSKMVAEEVPVILDFQAGSEADAILRVAGLLAGDPRIKDQQRFLDAVFERQKISPPLLGNGIALPHARTPAVSELVIAVGRSRSPVQIGEAEVRLIFLIGVPPHLIAEYLAMTSSLARRLRLPGVVESLLAAPDAEAFRSLLGAP